jgi:hypothetical protein
MIYPVHVQERFARLLKQRADQSRKAKVAPATLGKVPQAEDAQTTPPPKPAGNKTGS